ncbi:50S ribosomal protein L6 [Suttonella ornithocola]|uniref:Large ribosomal subunit protein uL6 n=1 Tax=Suttonella ornithocola TaxID=279832 RepID=A0A380MRR0_9GAMM|nr:50S ribosomal protein L6 [Suttonella ornithocola]SUO94726.1 50S ribosomal protein L6 [Suttonella ornithocola]
MSRVGKQPVSIPNGVNVSIADKKVSIKGSKGQLELDLHPFTRIEENDGKLLIKPEQETAAHWAMTGTMRALVNNMVIGVSEGFEKKLQLIGVGYRAQAQGQKVNLSLGFSHPIEFSVPQGITVETPSQTEILVKGSDKQLVGEVAAKIRAYRPPEPYKGKGVRYANEHVAMKEAKKK